MYIGIDVQANRACPYAIFAENLHLRDSGWLPTDALEPALGKLLERYPEARFGVDAPRQPLPRAREWYWRGGEWRRRGPADRGRGRHCEIVIKAHALANPQWTPLPEDAPPWMQHGFAIFAFLADRAPCYEVFPSASYRLFEHDPAPATTIDFSHFKPGPKDMLDAVVAAVTVHEFLAGRGAEVGGGDGLGSIILPRAIPNPRQGVFSWPGK